VHVLPDWILALATLVLAWATIRLVLHTKALAALTRELVTVEKQRDEREAKEKRRTEVARCLQLAEALREVKPTYFASQLKAGAILQPTAQHIRALSSLAARHIKDPDTVKNLRELRQWIDTVQMGGNIGDNEALIARTFESVQQRAGWSITEWRDELEGDQ
jgi:hypothetical protein